MSCSGRQRIPYLSAANAMGEEGDNGSSTMAKLIILLIIVASAAVVVTIYHCITARNLRAILLLRRHVPTISGPRRSAPAQDETLSSIENSLAELLPTHRFQKGKGIVGDEAATCAVCLSEFEEGEELRTLPECLHSFHAPCIDMWLYSHANCPMCRTDALPSPLLECSLER